jgi:acyl-CoA synthetase (AMP-forming)/AMP-acid ligase II
MCGSPFALSPGVPNTTTDAELEGWCRGKLPAYQVPSVWLRLESLPRNSMGKVNKIQLRDTLLSSDNKS